MKSSSIPPPCRNRVLKQHDCPRQGEGRQLAITVVYVESLPIPQPSDAARAEAEVAVGRLIALTQERRRGQRELLDWLRVEFGVETPGQKLEAFAALDGDVFADEVRRRRPRSAARLTPAALRDLRETHAASAAPIRALDAEALGLERRLSALVNAAYGLTPADVALLWRTAPPRMPVGRGPDR